MEDLIETEGDEVAGSSLFFSIPEKLQVAVFFVNGPGQPRAGCCVVSSGWSLPGSRHSGMQRGWPRGVVTEGWSTARSDHWGPRREMGREATGEGHWCSGMRERDDRDDKDDVENKSEEQQQQQHWTGRKIPIQ